MMTTCRVWPQEWAAERTRKGWTLEWRRSRWLEAGVDVVLGTLKPRLLGLESNTILKTEARVFPEEGGMTR